MAVTPDLCNCATVTPKISQHNSNNKSLKRLAVPTVLLVVFCFAVVKILKSH